MKAQNLLLVLFLLLASTSVLAVIKSSHLNVLAVTSEGKGLGADLALIAEPGKGNIWISAEPLVGTTTQSAARTARDVAKRFSSSVSNYDYKFSIQSTASLVDGPSAGAAMALMIVSALKDKQLPSNIALTGTIDEQGNVGPVGGVFEKAIEASKIGIDLFMIPRGEAVQTVRLSGEVKSINLLEYGPNTLGMTIVEVNNIDDVLKYAFTDVKSIDVSRIIKEGEIPDFVPKPIPLEPQLSLMKEMVNNYLKETNLVIDEAKNSVSSAIINDTTLLNTLLDTITSSQETMKQAEILNEQNYLYSAANFAFLARVNAMLVKDVSANPSLMSLNSTALDLKVADLKKDLSDTKDLFDKSIPIDTLEFYISAQQRLSYAEINIEKLSNTQVIVVNGSDSSSEALSRLSDYEFAVAWVGVAKDFFDLTKNSTKRVKPANAFFDSMNDLLSKGENALATVSPDSVSDISRRIDAAKLEKTRGWYLASVFDAATGYALASAESVTKDKDITALTAILESKINDVEKKLSASKYKYYWPVLYLDHAKYFLESANYYSNSSQTARAVNSLKSGISLIMLADQLFLAAEPMYDYYSNVFPGEFVTNEPATTRQSITIPNPLDALAKFFPALSNKTLLIGFLVALFLILAGSWLFAAQISKDKLSARETFEPIQLKSLSELEKKADSALLEGKISEQKHEELTFKYYLDMAMLEHKRAQKAGGQMKASNVKEEINALEKRLKELKSQYRQEIISNTGAKTPIMPRVEKPTPPISKLKEKLRAPAKKTTAGKFAFKKQLAGKKNPASKKAEL